MVVDLGRGEMGAEGEADVDAAAAAYAAGGGRAAGGGGGAAVPTCSRGVGEIEGLVVDLGRGERRGEWETCVDEEKAKGG